MNDSTDAGQNENDSLKVDQKQSIPVPETDDCGSTTAVKNPAKADPGSTGASNAVDNEIVDDLDLTKDVPARSEKVPEPAGDYDPRPVEDGARRTIAYLLIGLLWLIVAAILIMIAGQSVDIKDLKEFGVLLSPIIALVSAATGFYYGTKSGNRS